MKNSPEQKTAMDKMQPGVLVKSGFLGTDTRPLSDIIEEDEEVMQKTGISFEDTARKMRDLMEAARKGLGEPITVAGKWLVKLDEARGRLPCPFADGMYMKINVHVENLASGKSLDYSDLSLHLLEKHHFLQGKGAFYRLEAAVIKEVLEL